MSEVCLLVVSNYSLVESLSSQQKGIPDLFLRVAHINVIIDLDAKHIDTHFSSQPSSFVIQRCLLLCFNVGVLPSSEWGGANSSGCRTKFASAKTSLSHKVRQCQDISVALNVGVLCAERS